MTKSEARGYYWNEEMGRDILSRHPECNSRCEPGSLKHFILTTNPPKEKDTPKEAANELEEKERLTQDIYKAMQIHWLSERHDAILSLIESEKVKAVEELIKYAQDAWVGEMPNGTQTIEPVVKLSIIKAAAKQEHFKELESKEESIKVSA